VSSHFDRTTFTVALSSHLDQTGGGEKGRCLVGSRFCGGCGLVPYLSSGNVHGCALCAPRSSTLPVPVCSQLDRATFTVALSSHLDQTGGGEEGRCLVGSRFCGAADYLLTSHRRTFTVALCPQLDRATFPVALSSHLDQTGGGEKGGFGVVRLSGSRPHRRRTQDAPCSLGGASAEFALRRMRGC
jgi:hypothetical protein